MWTRAVDRLIGFRSSRNFVENDGAALALKHDSGFFSNCSVLLMHLARAATHPALIDVSESFSHFRAEGSSFEWNRYFCPPPGGLEGSSLTWPRSRVARRLPHHSTYRLIDFTTTSTIIQNYFALNPYVVSRADEILTSFLPVPLDQVLVVCVRGTDKSTEVRQSSIHRYVRKARRLMRRHKNLRVWVQTDQAQIRNFLLLQLGGRAFSIDVLPVTEDHTVIHRTQEIANKDSFTRDLLAITWLMSQAHRVITYTGNVGYWITLFRGNSSRLHQLR